MAYDHWRKDAGETEPHAPGNPLFLGEDRRRCAGCDGEYDLRKFVAKRGASDPAEFSCLCRKCLAQDYSFHQQSMDEKAVSVIETLNKKLERVNRQSRTPVPISEIMAELHVKIGGGKKSKGAANRCGRMYNRALARGLRPDAEYNDIKLGVDVANAVVKQMIMVDKNNPAKFDWTGLSTEEQIELLMEPARHLILNDPEFRRQLLESTEVRKLLLSDMGSSMLEASCEVLA